MDTPTLEPGALQRLFFLDWLRIAAFAVLVPYHVGMFYVRWDFHVKSPNLLPGLEPWMLLSGPWRMSLLFIVSGAATAYMLQRGASAGILRRRSARLLWPLLFGMAVVVPPQAYFEVVQKFGYGGGYLDFLALYFRGDGGFCHAGHCLLLPTWNHLWFLPYVWLYTVLLWLLLAVRPTALDALARLAPRVLGGAGLLMWPIAALVLLRLTLFPRFPSTHALVGDWSNHALYFGMFMAGAVFACWPGVWDALARWRWAALAAGLTGWALLVTHRDGSWGSVAQACIVATLQWGALVAALGWGRRCLNVDHPWRERLTEAVFPVYILHQTVIIVLTRVLAPLHWTSGVEALVLVIATFALSLAGYALLSRIAWLRPCIGLTAMRAARPHAAGMTRLANQR